MPDTGSDNSMMSLLAIMLEKNIVTSLDQVHDVIDRLTLTSRPGSSGNLPAAALSSATADAPAVPAPAVPVPVAAAPVAPQLPFTEPSGSASQPGRTTAPAAAAPKAPARAQAPAAAPRTQATASAPKAAAAKAPEQQPEVRPAATAQGKRPAPGSSAAFRDPNRLQFKNGRVVTAREMGQAPVVNPRDSIKGEVLVCLEDGRELKMLKRHLKAAYGMTPEQYKEKWELPSDYPVVSPDYSMQKSHYALSVGLGTSAMREEKARETEAASA